MDCPQNIRKKLLEKGYECIKLLGKGTYAKVYLVNRDDQLLAMKVINMKGKASPTLIQNQLSNELDVIYKLKKTSYPFCQFIVHLQEEVWKDGDLTFIPMRLAVSNLYDFITENKEKLTIDLLKNIFCQIARGLECFRKLGFVYVDLKPENVLVMPNGEMRVADLGSAYPLKKLDYSFFVANHYYISPEIAIFNYYNNKRLHFKITEKSMVFSLGIMLMFLFKGNELIEYAPSDLYIEYLVESPFIDLKAKLITDYRLPLSDQEKDQLNALLVKMLQKNPEKRPSLAQVMCDPFLKSTKCLSIILS